MTPLDNNSFDTENAQSVDSEMKTILVVDDNAMTARWVGHLAGQMGYNAVLASDGEQALQCLAQEPFVAVVADVEMPGLDGFRLLRRIRQLYLEMPVALMSVVCSEDRRRAALAWGARALLEKPVNLDHLAVLFRNDIDVDANDHGEVAQLDSVPCAQ